ncbi:MAG: hypothetical protein RL354_2030 [Planctomycetota bacterium]
MVVAARACEGEPEERAPGHIDLACNAVGFVDADIDRRVRGGPEEPVRRPEWRRVREPKRRARLEEVARDLLGDEARRRQVAVEGVDHPVAVAPRIGNLVVELMGKCLGVAREVEPVPPPALAEGRARERTVDERCEGRIRRIGDERTDIGLARRKPCEIKRRAAQQRRRIDIARGRCEPRSFARRQRKPIDVAARPSRVAHCRDLRIGQRPKRPGCGVLGASSDPRAHRLDLRVGQRLVPLGRHPLVRVALRHARQQRARLWPTRHDGRHA